MKWIFVPIIVILIIVAGWQYHSIKTQPTMGNIALKSSAFKEGETIPKKYTCDGDDINPMLEIRNVPPEAKSLALIVDDPDATRGVPWDHWTLWNINPRTQYISEDTLPDGVVLGTTSFGHQKYGGPCPQKGSKPHRYMFKLYALDVVLDIPAGATKAEVEKAMEGHILDQTILTGLYSRA
jgi:Raf kinase inhibitor-like YbhB/YbcL family protein